MTMFLDMPRQGSKLFPIIEKSCLRGFQKSWLEELAGFKAAHNNRQFVPLVTGFFFRWFQQKLGNSIGEKGDEFETCWTWKKIAKALKPLGIAVATGEQCQNRIIFKWRFHEPPKLETRQFWFNLKENKIRWNFLPKNPLSEKSSLLYKSRGST